MKRLFVLLASVTICLTVAAQPGARTRTTVSRAQQNTRATQTHSLTQNSARGINSNNYSATARRPTTTATRTIQDRVEEKVRAKMWKQIEASGRRAFASQSEAMKAVEENRANYVSSGNDVQCGNCKGSGIQVWDNAYIECAGCHGVGYHRERTAEEKARIQEGHEQTLQELDERIKEIKQDRKDMANQKAYDQKADLIRNMKNLPEQYYDDQLRKDVQDDMKRVRQKSPEGKVKYNKLEDWLRKKMAE